MSAVLRPRNLPPYPRNAQPIVDARASGLRPEGPVLVDTTGGFKRLPDDAMVYVDDGKSCRWDFVAGLFVVVLVTPETSHLDALIRDIDSGHPEQIDVVDVQRRKGWMLVLPPHLKPVVKWPASTVEEWLL